MTEIISFALVAFVSGLTPGPNNSMVLQSGMIFGFRRSLPHIGGITTGFFLLFMAVRLGLYQLFENYPQIMIALKITGSLYFIYIAWRMFQLKGAAAQNAEDTGKASPFSFSSAVLFQWVNIKAWFFAFSSNAIVPLTSRWNIEFILSALVISSTLISVCLWTLLGKSLEQLFSKPLYSRIVSTILSLSLLYVVFTWWQADLASVWGTFTARP